MSNKSLKSQPLESYRLGLPFLAAWRKSRGGITQEILADRIGKDRTIVNKMETGKLSYNQENLEACADVLQCEPWQLLVQNPGDPTWPYKLFHSLDSASRHQLIEIAKKFKE